MASTDESADRALARALMDTFARRTGLVGEQAPRRYLWTDAFAVCNALALAHGDDGDAYARLAARLVDQVHQVLGQHRPDDARSGWISGLDAQAGARQPTVGGLRIGKPLPERAVGAAFDPQLEWERDGQYFHYLTRWMHALDQFAHAQARADADRWACELAQAAVAAFSRPAGGQRLAWKMSIDLQRALVPSSGQHDALDGCITCLQLQRRRLPQADAPDLEPTIARLAGMAVAMPWETDDPLGLGGLLADAWRLLQVAGDRAPWPDWWAHMLDATAHGLARYQHTQPLRQSLAHRLAFRELGLAIGLRALPRMQARAMGQSPAAQARLQDLARHLPLADAIVAAWRAPAARALDGWQAHADINDVMLATALVPAGVLDLT